MATLSAGVLEQRLLPTGLFFPGVQQRSRPGKNSPVARGARVSTCAGRAGRPARGAGLTVHTYIHLFPRGRAPRRRTDPLDARGVRPFSVA